MKAEHAHEFGRWRLRHIADYVERECTCGAREALTMTAAATLRPSKLRDELVRDGIITADA